MSELYKTDNYLEPIKILDYDIDADIASTYNAWVDIEIFKEWFCPSGFTIAKAELTPKIGGHFTIHMKSPEGTIYPTKGEYILLQESVRIVYKDSWDDGRENNEPITTEIRFETLGTKTRINIYSSFANEKQKVETLNFGIIDGWKMFFNNLNTALNKK